MKRTGAASEVVLVMEVIESGVSVERLVRRAERVARGRRSGKLGARHLVKAAILELSEGVARGASARAEADGDG